MTKVDVLHAKIYSALEVIPDYDYRWAHTLYKTYIDIIEDALLLNETDAKNSHIFQVFKGNVFSYSNDKIFLENLKNAKYISVNDRAEVIKKLKSLNFDIRTATI